MNAFIQNIETSLPEHSYRQEDLREQMKSIVGDTEVKRRIIHQLYARSGIRTRYSILEDFKPGGNNQLFFNGQGSSPGTGYRNDIYIEKGRQLFLDTAGKLIASSGTEPDDITHLVTVSCTGFYAPGPDYDIIHALGLSKNIERYHLGFMGCYAVIPAVKLAAQLCKANPDANVMVISTELCSLHFQASSETDDLISSSVFSDGSAGVIISGQKPQSRPYLEITQFASTITENGKKDMAWSIGDNGFNMVLSTYIPEILSENLNGFLDPVLKRFGLSHPEIDSWAVHPGGRSILDRVEQQLDFPPDTLNHSRSVLAGYGNMSSATILFVLKAILEEETESTGENILAMAFGPGLTIESGLFKKYT